MGSYEKPFCSENKYVFGHHDKFIKYCIYQLGFADPNLLEYKMMFSRKSLL